MKGLILVFFVLAVEATAQRPLWYIDLGMPLGLLGEEEMGVKPKPGFVLGSEFWFTNRKGNFWSAGLTWSSFNETKGSRKQTYEYLTARVMPMIWVFGKKKQGYGEFGLFGSKLLLKQVKDGGAVTKQTNLYQQQYVGLSGGLGARFGKAGESGLLIGWRNDVGLLGFGSGKPLKFWTTTLFAGLNI